MVLSLLPYVPPRGGACPHDQRDRLPSPRLLYLPGVDFIDIELRPVDGGDAYDATSDGYLDGQCRADPNGAVRTDPLPVKIIVRPPVSSRSARLEWACHDDRGVRGNAWAHSSSVDYTSAYGCHFNVIVSAPVELSAGIKCVAVVVAEKEDYEQVGLIHNRQSALILSQEFIHNKLETLPSQGPFAAGGLTRGHNACYSARSSLLVPATDTPETPQYYVFFKASFPPGRNVFGNTLSHRPCPMSGVNFQVIVGGQEFTVSADGQVVAVDIDMVPYGFGTQPDSRKCCPGEGGQSTAVYSDDECCPDEVRLGSAVGMSAVKMNTPFPPFGISSGVRRSHSLIYSKISANTPP